MTTAHANDASSPGGLMMTTMVLLKTVLVGIGATALLDLWAIVLNRVTGWGVPNWAMVGRWVGHLPRGRFVQPDIGSAQPVANELAIGWVFHYVTGIVFAAVLVWIWGPSWLANPTFTPALIVGLATVLCGWLILSPGLGGGIAHAKRQNAGRTRILNIVGHVVFAIGLWGSALLLLRLPG